MSIALAEPSVDVLDELRGLLGAIAGAEDGGLGVLPGLTVEPGAAGWTPLAELVREPYDRLGAMIERHAGEYDAPRHVGAALFWKGFAYWHTMPMALGWALNRRVPLMPFAGTVFRQGDDGLVVAATSIRTAVLPGDPLAGDPGTVVTADLGAAVREALTGTQLPLVRAVNRLARLGERNMWGSTAEALAHPLFAHADVLPPTDPAELLAAVGRPVAGLLDFADGGYRRRTCCLWVTVDSTDACATCCVSARRSPGT